MKKKIIICLIVVILVGLIIGGILLLGKDDKEDTVLEKMNIDKFYEINSKKGIDDVRTLDKNYSFESINIDQCSVNGDNAFCFNTLENFIKDYKDKKTTVIRIITRNDNGLIIKDVYYDSNSNKIYLVVDKSRVTTLLDKDREIKMYEYTKIREYTYDNVDKIDLVARDIRDDYYLCDCIWEDSEVFTIV